MEGKYEVQFATDSLKDHFQIDAETRQVNLCPQIKELREDLRSIVIDEAIRTGEHLEELIKLPPQEKEQLNIEEEARTRARQVSLDRYGKLRAEAFNKLEELTS